MVDLDVMLVPRIDQIANMHVVTSTSYNMPHGTDIEQICFDFLGLDT